MPLLQEPSAYRQTLAAVRDLAERLTDQQWQTRTECPQWTVGDICAHVASAEEWMAAGAQPLTGSPQEWIDDGVSAHRGRTRAEVVTALARIAARRDEQLAAAGPASDATGWWPWQGKQIPLGRLWAARVFDIWVHEQDIRRAVGLPGNLSSAGARVTQQTILEALPRVVAKAAQLPAGAGVHVTVGGELPADITARVGDDGRVALSEPDGSPVTARLVLSWETLRLAATGRARPTADHVTTEGDGDVASRVLGGWNVAP